MNTTNRKLILIRDKYLDGAFGKQIYPAITAVHQEGNPIAVVCDFFTRKSTKSLDAICILCETGFHEDALILARTIFELALYLKDIEMSGNSGQQAHSATCFIYEGERQRGIWLNDLQKIHNNGTCNSWFRDLSSPEPTPSLVEVPNSFERPKKIEQMAHDLQEPWQCFYQFLYRSLSKIVHPSGLGSQTYLVEFDKDEECESALSIAFSLHAMLAESALNLLGIHSMKEALQKSVKDVIGLE